MIYRFYQDLATAHITELEQEAQDSRLARCRGVHVKSRLSYVTGLVPRIFTQLHRLPGSHRPGFRALAHLSIVPPQCADSSHLSRDSSESIAV
jgi:hypothetical protein